MIVSLREITPTTSPVLPNDTLRGLIESLGAAPVDTTTSVVVLNRTHAQQLLATLRRVRERVIEANRRLEVEGK